LSLTFHESDIRRLYIYIYNIGKRRDFLPQIQRSSYPPASARTHVVVVVPITFCSANGTAANRRPAKGGGIINFVHFYRQVQMSNSISHPSAIRLRTHHHRRTGSLLFNSKRVILQRNINKRNDVTSASYLHIYYVYIHCNTNNNDMFRR